jgi:hypothetical protein
VWQISISHNLPIMGVIGDFDITQFGRHNGPNRVSKTVIAPNVQF